jgi:hypothetical protein
VRLEELEKQTRKETVKEAHAAIIQAEKMGINTDQLREALVEVNNWDRIQAVTKDLKAKVELEAMKAQVKAEVKQDISQALHQTASQTDEASSTLSDSPTLPASETMTSAAPGLETAV